MNKILSSIKEELLKLDSENRLSSSTVTKVLGHHPELDSSIFSELPVILKNLPEQTFKGKEFSQYPLTILNAGPMNLDLYHWNNTHTSIHDHNFFGAFKVLKGVYRQKNFQFISVNKVNDWLEVGSMKEIGAVELKVGEVIEIVKGDTFIHSTEHPQGECVTACIRESKPSGLLHSYILPGLKITHTPVTMDANKILDYAGFLCLNFEANKDAIKKALSYLESSHLVRILFAINIPEFLFQAERRTLALQVFKERHENEHWYHFVKDALTHQKLHHGSL